MSEYICGRNAVMEILKSDSEIDKLYIQKGNLKGSIFPIIAKAKDKGIIINEVDKRKLDEISGDIPHQGVIAFRSNYKFYDIEEIINSAEEKNEPVRIIILDEIEDPHNMGAMIRTAEAAGCHGVIVQERRSCSINESVFKASSGAINYIPICQVTNINQAIKRLKKENIFVYGTSGYAKNYHTQTNLTGPIAIVIGNEGKGMRRLVSENCDDIIKIPIIGQIESLNASTACAVVLYEIVRQRNVEA